MTFAIYGTATSSGIAIGPACLLGTNLLESLNAKTYTTDRLTEANRLEEAVSRTIIYLDEVKNNIPSSYGVPFGPSTIKYISIKLDLSK